MISLRARLAAVVVMLAAGLCLKAARYAGTSEASEAEAAERVSAVMTAHGWTAAGPIQRRAGGFYSRLVFERPDCPRPVLVAFLSGNAESAELVRLDHAGEVAFVQDGSVVAAPSGLHRQLAAIRHGAGRWLGRPQASPLPVLAVWPAPDAGLDVCKGPAASAWTAVERAAVAQAAALTVNEP
ncbi:MAG: hypothetical protein SFW09_09680 [Hyphomicrobiaceae bacterium]|nr:hypothetical protein [Hyphomicrobiaceae bacterium]